MSDLDSSQESTSESENNERPLDNPPNINNQTTNFQCFLVISYQDFKLGIAFYRPGSDKLELLHEVHEYYDFNYIKTILHKVQPTDVIISSKVDTQLVNYLKVFSLSINETEQDSDVDVPPNISIESDEYVYAAYDRNPNTRLSAQNIEINTKIDTKLDEWKVIFNKLPEVLNRVMVNESDEDNSILALQFRNLTNLYVPQIGFLLAVPLVEAQKVPDLQLFGLEAIFCANDRVFCKNKKTKEFDTYYGDIVFNISEQSRKVLIGCRNFIIERKKTIKASTSLCAQLDAMIAMADTASKYKYTRPTLNVCGTTQIDDGRHPLYELLDQSFVPNPFSSSEDDGKICIVFGPNNCGKSVYLKQVSLIIYLAHIGSFVPAKKADIKIVDQIFTRIRTPESISSQLSAFKHDLNQIIMAIKYASKHSFVVIDFFGSNIKVPNKSSTDLVDELT
ncbi:MutS protein msh5 [Tyrophagus putrescentiae]|nr:MutS protein msh5 [Tyrophagus putrescentiae]